MKSKWKYYEFMLTPKNNQENNRLMITIISEARGQPLKRLAILVSKTEEFKRFNQYKLTEVLKPEELKVISLEIQKQGEYLLG